MIEVRNLVKRYGDHTAVDDLSFTVEKGQIYGLLGPNGAGKSTTMNIMTGYIGATAGEVLINGHDIFKEPEAAKRAIGYLPEMPPVYPDMTVDEYLKFSAQLKQIEVEDDVMHIEEVMELTQVTEVRKRLIRNLSKGYRQRVGLAHAIMGYPPIIILDEPTVGLDPKQIIEIRDLIKKLSEDHTIILSSHILSEISAVCDYVMIIAHGKLIASDTTENLTKMMMGKSAFRFDVKGVAGTIETALKPVNGIEKMEVTTSTEAGVCHVAIESKDETDLREAVFYALAEVKCPIMIMPEHASLEDIFLELTDSLPESTERTKPKRLLGKALRKEVNSDESDL